MTRTGADATSEDRNRDIDTLLRIMTTRRVVRDFTRAPVSADDLRIILTAARWASTAGNRHIHRFLVVQNRQVIRRVKAFAPGMLGTPTALIVICTDRLRAAADEVQIDKEVSRWIDVGTAAMNMMLAARAVGLGSCPATSFSKTAVGVVLELPPHVSPDFMLQVGHPAPRPRAIRVGASTKVTIDDLTFWESYAATSNRAEAIVVEPYKVKEACLQEVPV